MERMKLEGHKGAVIGCAISADRNFIVSCSGDKTVRVWDSGMTCRAPAQCEQEVRDARQ